MNPIVETIESAILRSKERKFRESFRSICCAIDAVIKKVNGKEKNPGRKTYKNFINEQEPIIVHFGFPGISGAIGYDLKHEYLDIENRDKSSMVTLADIVYHLIRCSLAHTCDFSHLKFVNRTHVSNEEDMLVLPETMIDGLILAVVLHPSSKEYFGSLKNLDYGITFGEKQYPLHSLWGSFDILAQKGHTE